MNRTQAEKAAAERNKTAPKGTTYYAQKHSFGTWVVREYDGRPIGAKKEHVHRRESDEMACRCGARWAFGEDHP